MFENFPGWLRAIIVPAVAAGAMATVSLVASAINANPISDDPYITAIIVAGVSYAVKLADSFLGQFTGSTTPLGHVWRGVSGGGGGGE